MSQRFTISLLLFSLLHCGDPPVGENPPPPPTEAPCAQSGLTPASRFPDGSKTGHASPFAPSSRTQARAAASQVFNLQYSTNLVGWMPAGSTSQQIVGSDDLFNWIKLTLPAPDPEHAFFRLELPTGP